MFLFPMAFMLVVTVVSLIQTITTNVKNALAPGAAEAGWCWARACIGSLLVILAVVLAIEGVQTIVKYNKKK